MDYSIGNQSTEAPWGDEKCEKLNVIVKGKETSFEIKSFSEMGKGVKFSCLKGSKAETFAKESKIECSYLD